MDIEQSKSPQKTISDFLNKKLKLNITSIGKLCWIKAIVPFMSQIIIKSNSKVSLKMMKTIVKNSNEMKYVNWNWFWNGVTVW